MNTVTEIFEANQVLTLAVAKSLIGKKIAITSSEYHMNRSYVTELVVADVISEWDNAANSQLKGWDNRQQYWLSYMSADQIDSMKNRLLLLGGNGDRHAVARVGADNCYDEPTFTGSDADRTVYYVVLEA